MAKPATKAVRGSTTGRPVMVLLDLLGRRWTLRILWELRHGPLTSRALREACDDASPTVLQARLGELRAADLVRHEKASGYAVTALGREFLTSFMPLYSFAERWAARQPEEPTP
ncbi:MAG TPA: helix-turn-helix domain-containing protein [Phenylobacterium sp.]